jgi:hypothetical protein
MQPSRYANRMKNNGCDSANKDEPYYLDTQNALFFTGW